LASTKNQFKNPIACSPPQKLHPLKHQRASTEEGNYQQVLTREKRKGERELSNPVLKNPNLFLFLFKKKIERQKDILCHGFTMKTKITL
jgi:hypothetical protein